MRLQNRRLPPPNLLTDLGLLFRRRLPAVLSDNADNTGSQDEISIEALLPQDPDADIVSKTHGRSEAVGEPDKRRTGTGIQQKLGVAVSLLGPEIVG